MVTRRKIRQAPIIVCGKEQLRLIRSKKYQKLIKSRIKHAEEMFVSKPDYLEKLKQCGDPKLIDTLLNGDWDIETLNPDPASKPKE